MIRNSVDQTVTLSIFKSHVGGRGGEGKEDRERRIYLKYKLNSELFLLIMSQHVYSFISVVSNFCDPMDPMDRSPPGSSGKNSGDHPDPGVEPTPLTAPALAGGFFTTETPVKPYESV